MRLKASDHSLSPTQALAIARKNQFYQALLHRRETASGLESDDLRGLADERLWEKQVMLDVSILNWH